MQTTMQALQRKKDSFIHSIQFNLCCSSPPTPPPSPPIFAANKSAQPQNKRSCLLVHPQRSANSTRALSY
jgi:hypothetical protein